MSSTAPVSGQAVIDSVRSELKKVFESAKRSYGETGNVGGIAESYTSADGEVTISLTGARTKEGKEYLALNYKVDGKAGDAVGRTLTGGIDMMTGQRYSADTQYGGPQTSAASDIVDSVDDIEALEKSITDTAFQTQEQQIAEIKSWVVGGNTFTDIKDYQAYNRVEEKNRKLADAMMKNLKFDSPAKENEFYKGLIQGLSDKAHKGDDTRLREVLKDIPDKDLEKATKGLSLESGAGDLIKSLQGMLTERNPDQGVGRLLSMLA
ncbi:hypothetical protein [Niveispirillum sp.]|uniref:hypothetical protein n=1 Tax=Niveispirillum sp. TaxID=1917217 RepID=UPI001B52B0A2|nr:hypothetical protein [Niveispirillum sp.]MBP7339544.1 hypothetical protein [Niveispirillum sp.]